MDRKAKLAKKYLLSLSGLLMLSGVVLLLVSGYLDWHNLVNNVGLAFTAAGVTTFLFKFDLQEMISDSGIRQSGVEAIKHGRNAMLEHIGGLEHFLRKARPKEIDICGIAMYSFFEPNSVFNLLMKLASEGYKIRIAFADPKSSELCLQEEVEHKPGSLKYHIEYLADSMSDQLLHNAESRNLRRQFTVVYSKLLPKAFLVRGGSKIIISQYFHRGPHFSPTFLIHDLPDGIFKDYRVYLDDIFESGVRVADLHRSTGLEDEDGEPQDV